jgi:hypothetical protein
MCDIEGILDDFLNLSLENPNLPNLPILINNSATNMAPPSENIISKLDVMREVEIQMKTVPRYDGNVLTLNIFIESCDYIINTYGDMDNPANPINGYICRSIVSKCEGKAIELIGSRPKSTAWSELKKMFLLHFGDQRNERSLARDLQNLTPHRNEAPAQFGVRVQDARSLLLNKVTSTEEEPRRSIKIELYDDVGLQTYLQGLDSYGDIGYQVRNRNPENLETAISHVLDIENMRYYGGKTNMLTRQLKSAPNLNQNSSHQSFQPNQNIRKVHNMPTQRAYFPQQTSNDGYPKPTPQPQYNNVWKKPVFQQQQDGNHRHQVQHFHQEAFNKSLYTNQRQWT